MCFFEGFAHSNNYGTNLSRNRGGSHTKGGNQSRGGGSSRTRTTNENTTNTTGSSWNTSQNRTETETRGKTRGYQIGGGIAETFHKKPLLETHEINSYLRAIPDTDCDDPAYPGLMLVRIAGEDPFFVRRSNYDQDPYFERCFSEDPLHGFVPLSQQPLLGYQYTPDHIGELRIPEILRDDGGIPIVLDVRKLQRFEAGKRLCFVPDEAAFEEHGEIRPDIEVKATSRGRVLELTETARDEISEGRFLDLATAEDGVIMTIKTETAYSEEERRQFENSVFAKYIGEIHQREEEARRLEEELQARLAREAEERRLEAERQAALLAQQKAEQLQAIKKHVPKIAAVIVLCAIIGYWSPWSESTKQTHSVVRNYVTSNYKTNHELEYNNVLYGTHCYEDFCFSTVLGPKSPLDAIKSGADRALVYKKSDTRRISWRIFLGKTSGLTYVNSLSYSEERKEIALLINSHTPKDSFPSNELTVSNISQRGLPNPKNVRKDESILYVISDSGKIISQSLIRSFNPIGKVSHFTSYHSPQYCAYDANNDIFCEDKRLKDNSKFYVFKENAKGTGFFTYKIDSNNRDSYAFPSEQPN